jgi:hypothetical protein
MKSQLTFTSEVLTWCTLDNHCDYYYLTLLVNYEHLNILAMYCYNLHPAQPEEDWPPLRAWFLSRFLPRFWPFLGVFPSLRASTITSALLAVWGFRPGFCVDLCDIN